MGAWNGWYHADGHTYGTWLPGDARGWREKQHKKHVKGDYRNPPPEGSGNGLLHHSRALLKHPPVRLNPSQREAGGRAMVETLVARGIEVLAISLDAVHYHVLGRFGDAQVRRHIGCAKAGAYHALRRRWRVGKVWERLCNVTPIADRSHQIKVFNYIREHVEQGAWVWTFREGLYWRENQGARQQSPKTPPGYTPGGSRAP